MVALLLAALLAGAVIWLVLDSRRRTGRAESHAAAALASLRPVASGIAGRAVCLVGGAMVLAIEPAWIGPTFDRLVASGGPPDEVARPPAQPPTDEQFTADSPAINALWSDQQQRMREFYGAGNAADLAAHTQRLRTALEQLDVPPPTPASINAASATGWRADLGRELASRREARFQQTFQAWRGQLIDPADEPVRAAFDQLRSENVRDVELFGRLAADLTLVESALNEVVGLDVPLAGGASADAIIGRWEANGLLRDRGVRDAAAPVLRRVTALREIQVETDTDRLLARTAPSANPEPEIVVAVWRRLARRLGVTWPASGHDVAEEARLGKVIRSIADGMRDKARAQALRDELVSEQRRRLERLLATADRTDQYAAAARAIEALGMKPEDFDARTRFNLLLHAFVKSLGDGGGEGGGGGATPAARPDDSAARHLAEDFLAQARALPSGLPYLADAAATIAKVEAVLKGASGVPTSTDGANLGPAATGRYTGRRDGDRLIFTLNGGGVGSVALEFVRIALPDAGEGVGHGSKGARSFYLGTTEVSVEMFVALARSGDSRGVLRQLVLVTDPASDPRVGPRTWEWDAAKTTLVPARRWLTVGFGNLDDQYAPGEPAAEPRPDSPMQWVTPRAAASAAAMVGCRLPSREEWNAAFARYGVTVPPQDCNLRDRAWDRHKAFVDKQLANGRNVQSADAGSFCPSGGTNSPTDDGILWFAPIRQGGGSPIHHLWGNVAEYVLDADGDLAPADPTTTAAAEFMARHGQGLFIAGSSSLSDASPAAAAPRPTSLGAAVEGFSDVGFRLAFGGGAAEADETSLAGRIASALTPTPYLTKSR